MSKKTLIWIGVGLIVLTLGILFFTQKVKFTNRHNQLHVAATSQEQKISLVYDRMWKTIQGEAEISNKYANDFKEIFVSIMDKRYSNGSGALMSFIQERNPEFDNTMYKKLMNTVESLRTEFNLENDKLVSIKQEHDNMTVTFPANMFIDNTPMEINIITSGKTKEVMRTGEDNDVKIF